MATKWSKKKVNPDNINSGNEYEKGDRVSVQALNSMVESGLYSQAYAEALTDAPDVSEAGNVGTPTVSFVDNVKDGATYKKFKFANLKGIQGEKGEQGIQGEKGEQGIQGEKGEKGDTGATPNLTVTATIDNSVGTPNVAVSESGTPENPIINLAFTGMKGADGSSPYANTSEGQTSGLNLNESSTLANLAMQILAAKTKVISYPIGTDITSANSTALRRLLSSPFGGYGNQRVEFKVFGVTGGFETVIEVLGIQEVYDNQIVRGYLEYFNQGDSRVWRWTGWLGQGIGIATADTTIGGEDYVFEQSSILGVDIKQGRNHFAKISSGPPFTIKSGNISYTGKLAFITYKPQYIGSCLIDCTVIQLDGSTQSFYDVYPANISINTLHGDAGAVFVTVIGQLG